VKLYFHSQCYPYANLNLDITNNRFAHLYDMYSHFQLEYDSKEEEPLLSRSEFSNYAPLAIISCTGQSELLKTGTVDVRLEFVPYENFPAGTTAYFLILHHRFVDYSPLSGAVVQRVQ